MERSRLHAETITTRLKKSFNLVNALRMGSHSRGTAVRAQSDLDLLIVFRKSEAMWGSDLVRSTTLVDAVRNDLRERYGSTEIRRDGQAIVVGFGAGSRPVDVVPAVYWGPGPNNWPLYQIPDGDGDWLQTSPLRHSQYLAKADEATAGKLKGIIRLIKFWRNCRTPSIPLSAFHLEMALADGEIGRGAMSYSAALTDAFQLLAERGGRALRDPLGVSGHIAAARTQAMRETVANALDFAHYHARQARNAELRGDRQEALRQWDIVFNGHFPLRLN